MTSSNEQRKKTWLRIFQAFTKVLKLPLFWGVLLVFVASYSTYQFYRIRSLHESVRPKSLLFSLFDGLELRFTDFRFQFRGPKQVDAPVALIAIDDASIVSVGRWPWTRKTMAHLLDQLLENEVAAIGMDVIFSEPESANDILLARSLVQEPGLKSETLSRLKSVAESGTPDEILTKVIEKGKDRIILGVFSEEGRVSYRAHQDYCRNEAFLKANANQFVKLNATFIVDDVADPFVDLPWSDVFAPVFAIKEKLIREKIGDSQGQASIEKILMQQYMAFCDQWLDPQDESKPDWPRVAEILGAHPQLSGVPAEERIAEFVKSVKAHPIAQRREWTINLPSLQEASQYSAAFTADLDSDGKIRRASVFNRTGNRVGLSFIPSISLQTFLVGAGLQARIWIEDDPANPNQKKISKAQIVDVSSEPETVVSELPLDEGGKLKINYLGGTASIPTVSAADLLNDSPEMVILQTELDPKSRQWLPRERKVLKKEFLKGRSVIVGATAVGVYDLRNTPFEKNFPGPEIHATVMANLFEKDFLKAQKDEAFWMLFLILVGGLIFAYFIGESGALAGLLVTFGVSGILFGVDQWLFQKGVVFGFVLPLAFFWAVYVSQTFIKYLTEERKKKELKSTFAKYVAPAVVEEILKSPENVELGGRKQKVSVFFSDVRGFTTISEKLDPQVLSDVLNEYLTPMTEIVFKNKGTLDKYIGDAVMAFFGAPISSQDHAYRACMCALESLEKLREIQKEFAARGLPQIDVGIGINTAEVCVGNMGSKIVRNYTVMGDGVNLGARLEGTNKEYGTRILISESTYQEVKDRLYAREVDWVRVKGKNQPIRIYELLFKQAQPLTHAEELQVFSQAYNFYRQRDFQQALKLFEQCLKMNSEDSLAEVYRARCADSIENPPPPDWDGVYVMKTK